jgi:methylmalonyl-CoA mutase N-terminal domain/subunit
MLFDAGLGDALGRFLPEYRIKNPKRAMEYISKIDEMGGALQAIEKGFVQLEIQEAAYQFQKAVERDEQIVVGLNAFQTDEKLELERLKVDTSIETGQVARLKGMRARRDSTRVSELLTQLEATANTDANLMPLFVTCVENNVTLGEICGCLRHIWGEYIPPSM